MIITVGVLEMIYTTTAITIMDVALLGIRLVTPGIAITTQATIQIQASITLTQSHTTVTKVKTKYKEKAPEAPGLFL